jgi:hypothetical protein
LSWRTEWKAISNRIEGLLEAGRFFAQLWHSQASDSYGTVKKDLLPQARHIFEDIKQFKETYRLTLSPEAIVSIERFVERRHEHFKDDFTYFNQHPLDGLKTLLPCLASFRAEFTFKLSDSQEIAKRITERAFEHLKRSIIADEAIKQRWKEAFKSGETTCEKLGAAHLLLHGIWAFKAYAKGERTDLILGEPLRDMSQVESTSEALVLTEWKVVPSAGKVDKKAEEAYTQAKLYGESSLAGFELASYRYLVLVSEDRLEVPPDKPEKEVIYRHINIPVNPRVPSKKT